MIEKGEGTHKTKMKNGTPKYTMAVFCRGLHVADLSSGESLATPAAKARQRNGCHLSDCPCFSKRQYVALLTKD